MKWNKKIRQLFCKHKYIDISGGGNRGSYSYTIFLCLNCYKQFLYEGGELEVNREI